MYSVTKPYFKPFKNQLHNKHFNSVYFIRNANTYFVSLSFLEIIKETQKCKGQHRGKFSQVATLQIRHVTITCGNRDDHMTDCLPVWHPPSSCSWCSDICWGLPVARHHCTSHSEPVANEFDRSVQPVNPETPLLFR